MELDGGRTERKIADHLFPETRLVGRTRRTLTVVAEPDVRVPATAAVSSVVQTNFVVTAGRPDSCRPSRPAIVAVAVVHVTENLLTNGPGNRRVSVTAVVGTENERELSVYESRPESNPERTERRTHDRRQTRSDYSHFVLVRSETLWARTRTLLFCTYPPPPVLVLFILRKIVIYPNSRNTTMFDESEILSINHSRLG